jgi:hypothetical protein
VGELARELCTWSMEKRCLVILQRRFPGVGWTGGFLLFLLFCILYQESLHVNV